MRELQVKLTPSISKIYSTYELEVLERLVEDEFSRGLSDVKIAQQNGLSLTVVRRCIRRLRLTRG